MSTAEELLSNKKQLLLSILRFTMHHDWIWWASPSSSVQEKRGTSGFMRCASQNPFSSSFFSAGFSAFHFASFWLSNDDTDPYYVVIMMNLLKIFGSIFVSSSEVDKTMKWQTPANSPAWLIDVSSFRSEERVHSTRYDVYCIRTYYTSPLSTVANNLHETKKSKLLKQALLGAENRK